MPKRNIGYEEGGQLTEQVRRNPYSIILFDEIEKAHPDVFNIFLQILDEGHLTDGQGRTISFKNCIIIMTSNIGSDIILKADSITDQVKQQIEGLLHKTFKPEFLNRIDAIVFFRHLDEKDVAKIAQLHINNLEKRLAEKSITLHVEENVITKLAELGYTKEFGARPLKRTIQHYIITPISQLLLKNPSTTTITVSVKKDQIVVE